MLLLLQSRVIVGSEIMVDKKYKLEINKPDSWLIVFLGKKSFKGAIMSILEEAMILNYGSGYNYPNPKYELLDVIPQIDCKGKDIQILARVKEHVVKPIKLMQENMPARTKIAVVFDKKDFKHLETFKMLARFLPIQFHPLPCYSICSGPAADFTLSKRNRGCDRPTCRDCIERHICSHSCIYRLACLLLQRDELPEEMCG